MSFADDLWDGFANVGKWEQQGTAMCKTICRFYRKRAKIEETYGRSMCKLVQQITDEIQQPGGSYCNDTICYGTLGSGWVATCHNAQVQAELHLNFAEQIRKNIVENLQVNTLQLEDQLKQITKDGERLLVDQDQWMTTLKKTKQAYYKAVKEAEAAKSVFDESSDSKMFSSKAEKRVNKASQEAQTAELAYHAQIKHTNSFMSSFNSELMPRVMKRLEDVGRSRQQLLLHHFKELARISQEMPNGLASAGNALAKAINGIDVQKDVQDFIKFNKTNQPRPQAFQYEPPSEEVTTMVDANKKGKHFFTIARKSKGSPQSLSVKGNPGSPPSLSPSPSAFIIREKAFKFPIFGNALDEIMGCQREVLPDCDIPYFLLVLALDILRSNAFCLEGVFRVAAPNHEIETIARQFDNGNYDLSSIQSPFSTTHLIKKWCRDLPDPLIPSYLYERCIACNTQEEAREILPMIPPLYNKVVVFLTQLLYEFSQPAYLEQSKMNAANFAMVFSPSFLRCASTEMADFLLNVHREKNFVQLLIEGVEERLTTDYIEDLMAPLDEVIFTKENPKWHPSKQIAVPPLQLAQLGGEVYDDDLKSELQRQASEREMILVKQQQLRKLTARDDISDPKALHAKLLDERAEKERFQDSVVLKDKTIQVMRTELTHTLQEKLKLENAVKALQHRIEKLETHIESDEPLSPLESPEVEGLVSWTPMRINVKENIQNYENKTRNFRSGSVDTGVDSIKQARASSPWQKLGRSISPVALKPDNRNTVHLGDMQSYKMEPQPQPEVMAPFKLPNSPAPFTLSADSARNPAFRALLAPLSEEQGSPRIALSSHSPGRKKNSSAPSSPRRSARASPEKESPTSSPASPISPRREGMASPRGVSFRNLGTVHVYQQETTSAQDIVATAVDLPHQVAEHSPRTDTPKIPRIKMLNAINPPPDTLSPRARSLAQGAISPRSTSTTTLLATPASSEVNSPRNPRHSTPAIGASPPEATSPRSNTLGFSSKKQLSESDPALTVTRTFSFTSSIKRKNSLKSSAPETSTPSSSLSKKSEEKREKKVKNPSITSSIDDQRIFDLLNTNLQKYDALSKKDVPTPPKPPSSGFQTKLRNFLQKGKSEDKSSKHAYAPLPEKSPRSPKPSPRVHSPRNRPHARSPAPATVGSLPATSSPISPRLSAWPEDPDYQATSPRQSRRTLSFPTPRVQNTSSSNINLANSPPRASSLAQSPRPTRSQTFLASGAASTQELHNLALEVDRMNKEVHTRLCACVETIGNTLDYAQTIEISKSIRLLIKCLDLALSKLGADERQMRQLGTGKSTLPEMKPLAAEDSRLKKLRDVLVISLDRIVGQMRCIVNIAAQITMQDDVILVSQTLSELQLFFSKQDQTISKIGPQEMVEGIRQKIDELKGTWYEIPLDRQVEISKTILDVKKDTDEFCTQNGLQLEPDQVTLSSDSGNDSQDERITKTIFSTLDKIHALCVVILQNSRLRTIRNSDNNEEGQFTEKLLEIFKALSTK
eukprot:Phypoly_transcript_00482.p1 GENE.Phypoly_transcript_00482~~Phypoly_transcript_00482.p1  ORF type:complete len:1511 (+),score=278.96 Phypoly_transcript_00482:105-4637(+)